MKSLKEIANKIKDYFNPESNAGKNFWSSPVGSVIRLNQKLNFSQQVGNNINQFLKPTYQQIPNTLIEGGKAMARLSESANSGLPLFPARTPEVQNRTLSSSLQDFGKVVKAHGVFMKPAQQAVGGLFGMGIGAINDKGFQNAPQNFASGVGMMQQYSPLINATNPLLAKGLSVVPLPGAISSRIGAGIANVGQGYAMNPVTENKYTLTQGAIDFLSGVAGGKSAFGGDMKLYGSAKEIDLNLKEVDTLRDAWNKASKSGKAKLKIDILNAADRNLPREVIDKYLNQPGKLLIEMQKNLTSKRPQLFPTINKLVGDTQPTKGGVPEGGVGVKTVDPFVQEMDALQQTRPEVQPKPQPIQVKNDFQNVQTAEARSALGTEAPKQAFADWVNARRATTVEGILQGKQFKDLDSKGLSGIFEFQSGEKSGRYADVKNYFDTKYADLQKQGVTFNYKQDYLPQLWKNTREEVEKVFGRTLSKKGGFTIESLFKNYKEGIDAGLTPKFNNISDLVRSYEQATNKVLADTKFFKYLADESMILPSGNAPRDWITLTPDRFPKIMVKTDTGTHTGTYKAPPEIADKINNYLNDANFKWLQNVADRTSTVKNRVLSFGIPSTAINAHGFNILARNVMASKNPIEGAITGIKYMINPDSALKYLDNNLSMAPEAVKNGLTLSANEFNNVLEAPDTFRGKFGSVWNKLFEKGLFDKMLPALKLQKYQEVYDGFVKSGMPKDEAGKAAAKFTNDVFGGINWEELGRSKDMQNLLRVTILAPDWLQTNINLAKKMPLSFLKMGDKTMAPYRKFLATFLGTYVTMNVVNKLSSGHWMYQNDPGNSFNIEAGYTEDGQKRYIRPFGTAADFIRLPSDVATGLAKGDLSVISRLVRNRLSIPLGVVVGAVTDTDYTGKPIGYKGTDRYRNEMPLKQRLLGVGGEVATLVGMPAFAKQGLDFASGKTGGEQALLQGLELPFRYSGGTYGAAQKQLKEVTGVKGKELYDQNALLKGQTKFSDKQMGLIKNQGLMDILKIREDTKAINDAKKTVENGVGEVNVGNKIIFKNKDGEISVVDLSPINKPQLTGMTELDKKIISSFNSDINAQANGIVKLWEVGKINQDQAESMLNELKKLKETLSPKKSKKLSIKKVSIKPIKIKSTTVQKYKTKKLPAYKITKVKAPNISLKVPSPKKFTLKTSRSRFV